jgi:hypothetical protein
MSRNPDGTKRVRKRTSTVRVDDAINEAQTHQRRRGYVYGEPSTETDPGEILLKEIQRTAGHVEWLRLQLSNSDPDLFVRSLWLHARTSGWVAPKEIDMDDWSAAGALWVDLYLKERQHLASITRTALAAGIEERRVRLAERMADRISEAIRGMLYDLELDPEDDRVRSVVFKWLSQAQGLDLPDTPQRMAIEG